MMLKKSEIIISVASDHAGFALKEKIIDLLKQQAYVVIDYGVKSGDSADYSDYVGYVVADIVNEVSNFGILICASGMGMSMMANRYAGIRAGLCYDELRTAIAREHNDMNVLCIGADFVTLEEAEKIINAFITVDFSKDKRHWRRLDKFNQLGEKIKKYDSG